MNELFIKVHMIIKIYTNIFTKFSLYKNRDLLTPKEEKEWFQIPTSCILHLGILPGLIIPFTKKNINNENSKNYTLINFFIVQKQELSGSQKNQIISHSNAMQDKKKKNSFY